MENGSETVVNHIRFDLSNTGAEELPIQFKDSLGEVSFVTQESPVVLRSGEHRSIDVFLKVKKEKLHLGTYETTIESIRADTNEKIRENRIQIIGPF